MLNAQEQIRRDYRRIFRTVGAVNLLCLLTIGLYLGKTHRTLHHLLDSGREIWQVDPVHELSDRLKSPADEEFVFGLKPTLSEQDHRELHQTFPTEPRIFYSMASYALEVTPEMEATAGEIDPGNGYIYLIKANALMVHELGDWISRKMTVDSQGLSAEEPLSASEEETAEQALDALLAAFEAPILSTRIEEFNTQRFGKLNNATNYEELVALIMLNYVETSTIMLGPTAVGFLNSLIEEPSMQHRREDVLRLLKEPRLYLENYAQGLLVKIASLYLLTSLESDYEAAAENTFTAGQRASLTKRTEQWEAWRKKARSEPHRLDSIRTDSITALGIPSVERIAPVLESEIQKLRSLIPTTRRLEDLMILRLFLPLLGLKLVLLAAPFYIFNLRRPFTVTVESKKQFMQLKLRSILLPLVTPALILVSVFGLSIWFDWFPRTDNQTHFECIMLKICILGCSLFGILQIGSTLVAKHLRSGKLPSSGLAALIVITALGIVGLVGFGLETPLLIAITVLLLLLPLVARGLDWLGRRRGDIVFRQVTRRAIFYSASASFCLISLLSLVGIPMLEKQLVAEERLLKLDPKWSVTGFTESIVADSLHNELLFMAQPLFPEVIPADVSSRIDQSIGGKPADARED